KVISGDAGRCQRDTDARPDLDKVAIDLVSLREPLDDTAGERGRLLRRPDILLKHHELVAAEPGDEILRTQHSPQPVGDHAQQAVAAGMTERIVDLLELIEIDEQQRGKPRLPVQGCQQAFYFVTK